jgi:L,D-peptidoglycan transpeptidase YkuD (ErfK/YbiS/YcfS/YnhG family)
VTQFLLRDGFLAGAGLRFRAAIGRAGVVAHKREGDGGTPAGEMALLRVLYRADRLRAPKCAVPVEPIGPQDGWCDDPADRHYNRMVRLPFAASHEILWRNDDLYDVVGVLDWNTQPVAAHRGSAIFLHLAARDYAPTAGCVALAKSELLACLAAGLTGVMVAP